MEHNEVLRIVNRLRELANEQGKLAAGMDQLEAHRLADNIREDCITMNRAADLLEGELSYDKEEAVLHGLNPIHTSWLD